MNLMLKSVLPRDCEMPQVNMIIDKIVMGLLGCKAVQKKMYIGTVRMQSQPFDKQHATDTTLTVKHNLYKLDNRERMRRRKMYQMHELVAIRLQHEIALS